MIDAEQIVFLWIGKDVPKDQSRNSTLYSRDFLFKRNCSIRKIFSGSDNYEFNLLFKE
jgi:hypothetical protein